MSFLFYCQMFILLSHFFFNTFILKVLKLKMKSRLCNSNEYNEDNVIRKRGKTEKKCEGVKTKDLDIGLPRSGIKTIFCICVCVYAPISQGAWSETVPAELYQTWSHNILNESFLLQHTFMMYIITCAVGYT